MRNYKWGMRNGVSFWAAFFPFFGGFFGLFVVALGGILGVQQVYGQKFHFLPLVLV